MTTAAELVPLFLNTTFAHKVAEEYDILVAKVGGEPGALGTESAFTLGDANCDVELHLFPDASLAVQAHTAVLGPVLPLFGDWFLALP
jgi:hypothetical protein